MPRRLHYPNCEHDQIKVRTDWRACDPEYQFYCPTCDLYMGLPDAFMVLQRLVHQRMMENEVEMSNRLQEVENMIQVLAQKVVDLEQGR